MRTKTGSTISENGIPRPTTLLRTMVRPKWIGALVFAMVVAALFAWLGQWQLGRAVQSDQPISAPTEQIKPLATQATPSQEILDVRTGQMITVTGSFVPGDYSVVSERVNHGRTGYWVTGHFTTDTPDARGRTVAVAIARGWAPTAAAAHAAIARLNSRPASQVTIVGRMLPTEAPAVPPEHVAPKTMTAMAVADLFNRWHGVDNTVVYTAYVVEHGQVAGLDEIFSPPPIEQATLNWLNVFYAVEWVVFAGFALYLWYRVVKDVWEREHEDAEEAAARATIGEKVD